MTPIVSLLRRAARGLAGAAPPAPGVRPPVAGEDPGLPVAGDDPGRAGDDDYARRLSAEIEAYRDVEEVASLPPIEGWWAARHVLPLVEPFGFRSETEFYLLYLRRYLERRGDGPARAIAIGAGNCRLEVDLAAALADSGDDAFTIECMDVNPFMLERGRALARQRGVEGRLRFVEADANRWQPDGPYGVVIANHSLHHLVGLEHLFAAIRGCLDPRGWFLAHDMIGRNGHMRWPEALEVVDRFWAELPESHRYNHLLKRTERRYVNFDCSVDGFEGIRAQDILPLLIRNFHFELFVPFGAAIDVFVDRCFGPNFDPANERDRDFVDRVAAADRAGIEAGTLKPTHMVAAMTVGPPPSRLVHGHLTPEFCVRRPD